MVYFVYFAIGFAKKNPLASRILRLVATLAVESALVTLAGLSEPRAFLFLTPMLTSLMAIGLVTAIVSYPVLSTYMYALPLVVSLFVIGSLRRTTTPFKRNAAIPFDEIVDFINSNRRGYTVVLTSDTTVRFAVAESGVCAELYETWSHRWRQSNCNATRGTKTIIVVKGAPLNEQDEEWRLRLNSALSDKQLAAIAHFGRDTDAELKSRLTGTPLPQAILDASIYR